MSQISIIPSTDPVIRLTPSGVYVAQLTLILSPYLITLSILQTISSFDYCSILWKILNFYPFYIILLANLYFKPSPINSSNFDELVSIHSANTFSLIPNLLYSLLRLSK